MFRFLDKIIIIFFAGIFFACNNQETRVFCDFNLNSTGRVQVKKDTSSHLSLKTKKYLLKKWIKESIVSKRINNIVFSEDSTNFSATALFPFSVFHPTEIDTIIEETNLKFDIYIEITETNINYYFLDFQLYYEAPENPFLGGGRMKGVNDKEHLNKHTRYCNPTKEDFLQATNVVEKELRQIPAYFKKNPPKKIVEKYVNRIIEQGQQISLKAAREIGLTEKSIEEVFLAN